MIEHVKSKSLVEAVIDELVKNIRDGSLKPGDKLDSQQKLSKNLNVGRSCIREALQALSMANVIDIRPGKGVFISKLSIEKLINPIKIYKLINKEEIFDLWETRMILETAAVKIAIKNATKEEVDNLENQLKNMENYIKENRLDLYCLEDFKFHKTIISLTHNSILKDIFNFIHDMLMETIKITVRNDDVASRGFEGHKKIFKEIKSRDEIMAENSMIDHLKTAKKDIEKNII